MKSPFTGGKVSLLQERKKLEFRKDYFEITQLYYKCKDTDEEFSTDDLDQTNLNQLYNQYRVKYGIPFPEEIREIREQYKLSASKISEILGLGTNSYRQYESGDIPTVANGRLILAAKDPQEFVKFIEASKPILSEKDHAKYQQITQDIIKKNEGKLWDSMFLKQVFKHSKPSEFTGYRVPNEVKIAQMIGYFSHSIPVLFKTKLNKLLFYSDFHHFKNTGYSISGIAYRAIQMGPVPAEYDKLYIKLVDDNLVNLEFIKFTNGYGEALTSQMHQHGTFSESEIASMNQVIHKFGHHSTNKMVDISHLESAWISNAQNRELISYTQYAFSITQI